MKKYVMKPVLTPVPVVWSARTDTGLKPAKRKTPARRIQQKEERRRRQEQWNDPAIRAMIDRIFMPIEPINEMKIGEQVVFRRYRDLKKEEKLTEKIRGKINVFMDNRRLKKRIKEMDRQKIGSLIYEIERNRNNE